VDSASVFASSFTKLVSAVQRDVEHDLDDFGIAAADPAALERLFADLAALARHQGGELHSRIRLGVVGGAVAVRGDLSVIELGKGFLTLIDPRLVSLLLRFAGTADLERVFQY
jgi:hypothetical protein